LATFALYANLRKNKKGNLWNHGAAAPVGDKNAIKSSTKKENVVKADNKDL
jgi:hypothetical protein